MVLGQEDGDEFDEIEIALIAVLEEHVPDEFVLGGHVVVSDHSAIPQKAELHPDVPSHEMMRGTADLSVGWGWKRGSWRHRVRCRRKGDGMIGERGRVEWWGGTEGRTRCSCRVRCRMWDEGRRGHRRRADGWCG